MASCFKKAMEEDEDERKEMTHKYNRNNMSHMLDKINYSSTNRMKQQTTKILLENPDNLDVFGYDSYYDNIQKKRQEIVEQKKEKGKVRFMDSLRDAAENRKLERSIIFEKLAHKELEKEGKGTDIKNSESFITASYKEVLEANRKFQIEDDLKEKYNEKNSASNKSDLSAIYKTFYSENLFAGGDRIDINAKMKESNEVQKKINELKETQATIKKTNNEKNNTNIPKEIIKSRSRSRSGSNNKNKNTNLVETRKDENVLKKEKKSKETEKNEKEEKVKNIREEKDRLLEKNRKIELAKKRFEERKKIEEQEGKEGGANENNI